MFITKLKKEMKTMMMQTMIADGTSYNGTEEKRIQ